MADIINFENNKLPAYLQNQDFEEINKDLEAHDTVQYPVISIRGRQFRIVRGGEETLLTNPLDPKSPASYITVVMIKASGFKSKAYYEGTYDANAVNPQKPVCWSSTGLIPDAEVETPCSASCALCPKNQFGSAVSADGVPTKAKACRDSVRIAVAAVDNLKDPMLLRVPPTSIKVLGKLSRALQGRKIPYTSVIYDISFDPDSTAQKLVFTPAGFVSEEMHKEILELGKTELIKQITGTTDDIIAYAGGEHPTAKEAPAIAKAVATGTVTPEAVKEADIKAPIKKAEKKKDAEITTSKEIKGLDDLDFDD